MSDQSMYLRAICMKWSGWDRDQNLSQKRGGGVSVGPVIWGMRFGAGSGCPNTVTLDKLDRIIQSAMGWKNTHMHAFAVGAVRYAIPDPDWPSRVETLDERLFDLATVLAVSASSRRAHAGEERLGRKPRHKRRPKHDNAGAEPCVPANDFVENQVTPQHTKHWNQERDG